MSMENEKIDEVLANENVETIDETVAMDSLHPASRPVTDDPKSKIEIMTQVLKGLDVMPKKDLLKWFDQQQAVFGPGKDHGVGDKSGHNQSSIDMKSGSGPKTKDPMPKLSVKEDVEAIFAENDLTEEFKEKASTLFEAAINARLVVETARLEEEYEAKINEAIEEISSEITEQVDSYLNYAASNWMEENRVAIESTLRSEITEEFIGGLKSLFVEHYIELPEDKVDVVEAMADKVEKLEEQVDTLINENAQLAEAFVEVEKKEVLESYIEDLALSQRDKFFALAEGIDFDGNLETYSKKLSIIKENYFGEKKVVSSTNIEEETFEGETTATPVVMDPSVSRYVSAISRTIKK